MAVAALVLVAGCRGYREREADRPYTAGIARVERVDVSSPTGFSTSARITATGFLPDACTEIHRVDRERFASRIQLTITTRRESGATCPPALVPFQRSITVSAYDLPPGLYTVTVNGVSATFDVVAPLP